jgi:TonB family protein
MIRHSYFGAIILLLARGPCIAQNPSLRFPEKVVIARDSFIDIGPPFHYYELIRVESTTGGVAVERVLATPPGTSCMRQPAKVESQILKVPESMEQLLDDKNPCSIPEKSLHRELKRRNQRPVFSGENITMRVSCGGKERLLHMEVLDRDLFDARPDTPEDTSWTMTVLGKLDKAISANVLDKPVFTSGAAPTPVSTPDTSTVRELRDGRFDALFGRVSGVSEVVRKADLPPAPPPSVELSSVTPIGPVLSEMPLYPPIARAARQEGKVAATYDVDMSGRPQSIEITNGNLMLREAVRSAISGWEFPSEGYGKSGQATFEFKLNCDVNDKPQLE